MNSSSPNFLSQNFFCQRILMEAEVVSFCFSKNPKGRSHNPWQTCCNRYSDISRTFKFWSLQILCNCLTQYLKSFGVCTFFHSDAWMHPKRIRKAFQILILSVFRPNPLSGMAWQCWKISWVWEFPRWSQQMQRNNWQHRWQNLGQHWFMAHETWKGCDFRILLILWRFFLKD